MLIVKDTTGEYLGRTKHSHLVYALYTSKPKLNNN